MINPDPTAERRTATWVQLLTAWKAHNLPDPTCIDAQSGAVWLPENERGQVDAWVAAMGFAPARINSLKPRPDGTPARSALYVAYPLDGRCLSAMCRITLGDASEHWAPAQPSPLAAALTSTAEHLVAAAVLTPDSPDLPAEPAAPRPYSPRPHSIVAGFGGAFCEPCRTASDDYRCEDLTCSCRCRAADLGLVPAGGGWGHAHPGSDAPCYCDISDAELAEQHKPAEPAHRTAAEVIAYINSLPRYRMENPVAEIPEVVDVTGMTHLHWRTGLILADGTELIATAIEDDYPCGWVIRTTAEPVPAAPSDLAAAFPADPHAVAAMGLTPTGQLAAPVAVSPERVEAICVELNRLNLEGAADAETVYIWNLPELDKVTQRSELNEAFAFTLRSGIAIEFSSAHGWQQVAR